MFEATVKHNAHNEFWLIGLMVLLMRTVGVEKVEEAVKTAKFSSALQSN